MFSWQVFRNYFWQSRNFHNRRWLLAIILSFWTTSGFAANLTPSGVFIVSQITGAVTYCLSLTNLNTLPPNVTGTCLQIGQVSPDPTNNPSLSIGAENDVVQSGSIQFNSAQITNIYSGQVVLCVGWHGVQGVNNTNPSGRCVAIGTASR